VLKGKTMLVLPSVKGVSPMVENGTYSTTTSKCTGTVVWDAWDLRCISLDVFYFCTLPPEIWNLESEICNLESTFRPLFFKSRLALNGSGGYTSSLCMNKGQPEPLVHDGQGFRIGIVAARYNQDLVDALIVSAFIVLRKAGVAAEDIETVRVPGSHELPYAARMLAATGQFDCIIALGVVLEGETSHARIIGEGTVNSFMRIMEEWEVPVINGIVTANTLEQAELRCKGNINRGGEFGAAALEMAAVKLNLTARLDEIYGEDDEDDDEDVLGKDWKKLLGENDDNEPWKS
ncbi:MAG: 6,7-dimethyl-8-ribityllumazine synthase, partial [Verrucomicrobiota bacterium]|nr:6,7-dimethyl-8-ribityllumazine synthase [Verrucomicrobiota bacterium]